MPGPPARLLDLTRLVSRLGRGPMTGVDRVEFAYLRALLERDLPCFGLVRTQLGVALLDRAGMGAIRDIALDAVAMKPADLLSRLVRRQPERARADAEVRRIALARAPVALSGRMLRKHLPQGAAYLNTGHTNLGTRLVGQVRRALGGPFTVFVHDTIPLDFPEYSRPGIPERFARKMQVAAREADLLVFSTETARQAAEPHFRRFGRMPPSVTARLGVDGRRTARADLPSDLGIDRPFFLALGTIEPRKNHGFLLDLWERMAAEWPAADVPQLVVAGSRGWPNADVFRRLDALRVAGDRVLERPGLSDEVILGLMNRCEALLFPTRAEGFGLPAVEAAACGCPIICTPLPVFREILGDYPVYLSPDDGYSWLETVRTFTSAGRQAKGKDGAGRTGRAYPGWDAHFERVLNLT